MRTNNALVNQLMHNIAWTHRGNMLSTGTDCPQRDERLGWAADFFEFSQTASFGREMAPFMMKWLQDMRDEQLPDGRYPDWAPDSNPAQDDRFGAPGWGDGAALMPWVVYRFYGDTRALERALDSVIKWHNYCKSQSPGFIWSQGRHMDYGEWLNGDTQILDGYPRGVSEMPKEQFATAFMAYTAKIAAQMARVVGREDDAAALQADYEATRAAYRARYLKDGALTKETQAGYALTLNFGLADESERAFMTSRLLALIEQYSAHISTGIHATHRMMLELTKGGQHAEANRLLNLRTVPSWGYMIDQGATTIWERWDGYVAGRGFQNPSMNSFNHWAIGSVGEWIWRTIVGINPDDAAPGFKHVIIRPLPDPATSLVSATYDSIRGPITIKYDWDTETGAFDMTLTLPPGVTATVDVPGGAQGLTCGVGTHTFNTVYKQ